MPHLIPGTGGAIVGVSIFILVWVINYRFTPYDALTFEPRGQGSFETRLTNYVRAAETLIGLASGSVVLLAGSSILRTGGILPWFYASPLVLLAMTVVFGISFIGLLIFFYEGFLHDAHSYTRKKYSSVRAFGFSSLICFSLSYLWLAFTIANLR